ncbi:unnamed protein product [Pylaiella littoralis]
MISAFFVEKGSGIRQVLRVPAGPGTSLALAKITEAMIATPLEARSDHEKVRIFLSRKFLFRP